MSVRPSERSLEGAVAIVTGAGRGIGRAVAFALAERGVHLALAGRTVEQLEDVAKTAHAKYGVRAIAVPTDVRDQQAVDSFVSRTIRELGDLHILVNNAGVWRGGPFLETPLEEWDEVLETNLRGTMLCCRAAGAHLVEHGRGKVINVASFFGERGSPGSAAYCASKAAIINLTRVLAIEWAPRGIQVNAVAPGYIETDLNADMRGDERALGAVLRRIPGGRLGRPGEVAALVAFLAGPESDFIAGSVFVIDGGQLARV